jgi:hypothetical protein
VGLWEQRLWIGRWIDHQSGPSVCDVDRYSGGAETGPSSCAVDALKRKAVEDAGPAAL